MSQYSTTSSHHIDTTTSNIPQQQTLVPSANRQLRACLKCNILLTQQQFVQYGCPNCPHLGLANNKKRIEEYTTTQYEGMNIILDETRSWIAKWQQKTEAGAYAMKVYGDVPEGIEEDYEGYEEDE